MKMKIAAEAAKLYSRKMELENRLSTHIENWFFYVSIENQRITLSDNERQLLARQLCEKYRTEIKVINRQIAEL